LQVELPDAAKIIIKAANVIFTKVGASLNLNKDEVLATSV
jgi:hypothetical protein